MGPLMSLLGNVIPGIMGLGQSVIEGFQQRANVNKTIEANMNLAKYQFSKDVEMWNRANEYNSPAAQMQRYTSAGLNPNLIYGSGASAGNTATTLPKYNAPTVTYDYKSPVNLGMMIGMFNDFRVKQAQVDNLREQNRILTSTADMKYLDSLAYATQSSLHEKTTGLSTLPLIRRELTKSMLMRSQADALRVQTDLALRQMQLAWFKKLGVSGLGGIVNAASNIARTLR